jgi:hypothetical protein
LIIKFNMAESPETPAYPDPIPEPYSPAFALMKPPIIVKFPIDELPPNEGPDPIPTLADGPVAFTLESMIVRKSIVEKSDDPANPDPIPALLNPDAEI